MRISGQSSSVRTRGTSGRIPVPDDILSSCLILQPMRPPCSHCSYACEACFRMACKLPSGPQKFPSLMDLLSEVNSCANCGRVYTCFSVSCSCSIVLESCLSAHSFRQESDSTPNVSGKIGVLSGFPFDVSILGYYSSTLRPLCVRAMFLVQWACTAYSCFPFIHLTFFLSLRRPPWGCRTATHYTCRSVGRMLEVNHVRLPPAA